MNLDNIRIVLVNTSHPGNIGGVARAMKNMGLQRLYLVAPRQFPDEQADWRAASAGDPRNSLGENPFSHPDPWPVSISADHEKARGIGVRSFLLHPGKCNKKDLTPMTSCKRLSAH